MNKIILILLLLSINTFSAEKVETMIWNPEIDIAENHSKISNTDCHVNEKCFEGYPTKWNAALMRFKERKDISKFDSIEFYIKSFNKEAPLKISVYSWSGTSIPIDIKSYLPEDTDFSKFQKVTIPIQHFNTNKVNLSAVSYFLLNKNDVTGVTFKLIIDNVMGVTGSDQVPIPPEEQPPQICAEKYTKLRPEKKTPYGCNLGDTTCTKPGLHESCQMSSHASWPNNSMDLSISPLGFVNYVGPYLNKAGYDNTIKVNKFHSDKKTLGLNKEKFRSFDALIHVTSETTAVYKAHSRIRPEVFKSIEILPEVPYFDRSCTIVYDIYQKKFVNRCTIQSSIHKETCKLLFEPRVNYAVRSLAVGSSQYGTNLLNIADFEDKNKIKAAYLMSLMNPETNPHPWSITIARNNFNAREGQTHYRRFYENNVLFASPATRSYNRGDYFTLLTPFILNSDGASGTDNRLLNPIIRASASIPKVLKQKIMDTQKLTPTLMYLLKHSFTNDYENPDSHNVAYKMPEESFDLKLEPVSEYAKAPTMPAPFLEKITDAAAELTHIPPIARMKIHDVKVSEPKIRKYYMPTYYKDEVYLFHGALRVEENIEFVVDLWDSVTDDGEDIKSYHHKILRGNGKVTKISADGSILKIEIPYTKNDSQYDTRTDILLYVNDGKYNSAPAYISFKHIQASEEKYYFE